jgi:hypothetical protein
MSLTCALSSASLAPHSASPTPCPVTRLHDVLDLSISLYIYLSLSRLRACSLWPRRAPRLSVLGPSATLALLFAAVGSSYLIGTGIGDVTGPAAEVNLMGYAVFAQVAGGIHLRLFSRAYIVVDEDTGKRIAFASVDWGMASQVWGNFIRAAL